MSPPQVLRDQWGQEGERKQSHHRMWAAAPVESPPFPGHSQAGSLSGGPSASIFPSPKMLGSQRQGVAWLLGASGEKAVAEISHRGDPCQLAPPCSQPDVPLP